MPSLRVGAAAREALRKSRAPNMMRNHVPLYCLPHAPCVLVKLLLFGVLIGPRRKNLHCMLRGLRDGVRGRAGPAPGDVMEQASQGTV